MHNSSSVEWPEISTASLSSMKQEVVIVIEMTGHSINIKLQVAIGSKSQSAEQVGSDTNRFLLNAYVTGRGLN